MTLSKSMGPFSCYCRMKANSAAKQLYITNANRKGRPANLQIGPPINSLFVYCQSNHRLGVVIIADCALPQPHSPLNF